MRTQQLPIVRKGPSQGAGKAWRPKGLSQKLINIIGVW